MNQMSKHAPVLHGDCFIIMHRCCYFAIPTSQFHTHMKRIWGAAEDECTNQSSDRLPRPHPPPVFFFFIIFCILTVQLFYNVPLIALTHLSAYGNSETLFCA